MKELSPSLEMVTLKWSSDSKWPLGVVSGFSISNFVYGVLVVHNMVELVCHFFVGGLDINIINISLIGTYQ